MVRQVTVVLSALLPLGGQISSEALVSSSAQLLRTPERLSLIPTALKIVAWWARGDSQVKGFRSPKNRRIVLQTRPIRASCFLRHESPKAASQQSSHRQTCKRVRAQKN